MAIRKPRGTQDFLPEQMINWHYIEQRMREICKIYGFNEIRTPAFEETKLFLRGIGETTDVVQKEMYTFTTGDDGGSSFTLRPENTASAVRAYLENKVYGKEGLTKWYYMGPMFRYERPQAGRLREFHQIGAECFGSSNPATDVEMIAMAAQFFKDIGITNVSLELNSLGNPESRAAYRQALIDYLTPLKASLSADSQRRLEENPLRVLDSKEPEDKAAVEGAPSILDYLDEESSAYFAAVRSMLETLQIPYVINTNMVRGLDYYNHTIFEFTTEVAGSQLTICAGGRYDGLVAYFGGPETPGVGFGMGLERLLLVLDKQGVELPIETALDVYVAVLGASANGRALELVQALRAQGFAAERDYLDRKLKAQFKSADNFKAKTLITLGESEVESGRVTVKNNHNREEITVSLDQIQENYQLIFEKLGF